MITLLYPENKATFSLMTDIYREFFKNERAGVHTTDSVRTSYPWIPTTQTDAYEFTLPASLLFKWKHSYAAEMMKFEISTSPDFGQEEYLCRPTVAQSAPLAGEDGVFFTTVTNLLVGTTYYWRVVSSEGPSEVRELYTVPNEVRAINAGKYFNIRDLGGRVTAEGKTVAQGKIYRGGGLDSAVSDEFIPDTEEGIRVLRDDIGIKCEIELASEAEGIETKSRLGDSVNFHYIPIAAYGGTLNEPGRAQLKKIFELLCDESNYPIYYHCVVGADRTGTISFLLDALLGFSEEDIIANYNLTALTKVHKRCWTATGDLENFFNYMNEQYPGHTVAELLLIHLESCGIGKEKLQRLRKNLLEQGESNGKGKLK